MGWDWGVWVGGEEQSRVRGRVFGFGVERPSEGGFEGVRQLASESRVTSFVLTHRC